MSHLVPDLPLGPLDFYRKKASFDWKKLKVFIDTEPVIKFQNEFYEVLKNHPEYQHENHPQTLDEQRRTTVRRALANGEIEILTKVPYLEDTKRYNVSNRILGQFDMASSVIFAVGRGLFAETLRAQGVERHHKFLERLRNGEIDGCFCLTEIGHGSNTKGMKTTATYDKDKEMFILNTPNFEAAKCWSGALGIVASLAVVYAQLYIDGVKYGLHTFLVPIRNPKTLLTYPGVIVGDMGEKIGLNGIDNGFVIFDNYHIPRENLLSKNADVTVDGKYVTVEHSKNMHGATLAALYLGRAIIPRTAEAFGTRALTIAIRYAAVRRQFGPKGEEEVPILEYQSHHYRLLPYLAAAYVVRVCAMFLVDSTRLLIKEENIKLLTELAKELHVVCSGAKPVASWLFRDAIQECREACGAHGYLKAAALGDIRNDADAICTYEGENNVLIQQTSNWLVKLWPMIEKRRKISTPLKSADFLSNAWEIINHKFTASDVDTLAKPENIMDAYEWLVCYLLKETRNKLYVLTETEGEFWAKNNTQVFYAKSLATAFTQRFFLQYMLTVISEATDISITNVLLKLFSLYGLWSLEKFLPTLYEGGYAEGPQPSRLIHEAVLKLCSGIKDDAVSLVDAIAPPDFIVNSVLGASDGQVYKHLQKAIFQAPNCMSRPTWWKEIVNWKANLPSKL